jgi:hypothetical protein
MPLPVSGPTAPSSTMAVAGADGASDTAALAGAPSTLPDIDPELLSLPNPPRAGRTLTILVLAVATVAALAMVFALRRDVAYALRDGAPVGLGDLRTASDATLASYENRLVRAEGLLGAAGGIRYERPLRDDTFRALPVAGRSEAKGVWVEVSVPPGEENGRWQPPRSFVGRLVRFDAAGPRHRGLAKAIEEAGHARVPGGSFLLVDGEEPGRARWVIVLAAIFLVFAAGNALAIARLVRRVA